MVDRCQVALTALFAALILGWCGCVVSPVPEPPTLDPDLLWIELITTNPDDPSAEVDTANDSTGSSRGST